MDLWVARHWNRTYDENGALAAKGSVNEELLVRMLQHEYFARPAPKSTGRDLFNEAWLDSQLVGHYDSALTSASAALQDCEQVLQQRLDVLATLLALTARSIALHLQRAHFAVTQVGATSSVDLSRLYLASFIPDAHTTCAYHISRPPSFTLSAHRLTITHRSLCVEEACTTPRSCSSCNICAIVPSCLNPISFPQRKALLTVFSSSESVGVDPQAVEAMAFAWLAHAHCTSASLHSLVQLRSDCLTLRCSRAPGNVPAVTGALGPRILGCMHPK
jgi:1,6-anhydro-N-acetylmuramate kinase